jgi:murein L,D-transpeptidase YafK
MYRLAMLGLLLSAFGCAINSSMQTIDSSNKPIKDDLTPDGTRRPLEPLAPLKAPRIVITKHERNLDLFDGEELVRTYRVSLGFSPIGGKERQGDGKTPEGEFYIFTKNPESKFYLSLGISYPSAEDAERGLRDGMISRTEHAAIIDAVKKKKMPLQNTNLGGEIYLHGGGTGDGDWTQGCAALSNRDIKELFEAVPAGTAVVVLP